MAERNETGKEGELLAVKYLQKKGYKILQTNWHWHHYELDIVATDGRELVVVEVKTRGKDFLVDPAEAVDGKKIRRIVDATDAYARLFNVDMPVRFDIIAIVKGGDTPEIDHIEDAFMAPCNSRSGR
jgi:putative endonuclease